MRRIYLVICTFCAASLVAGDSPALTPSTVTFAATLQTRFGVDPVVPFDPFDKTSQRARFPGATVTNVEVNPLADKGKVLRLSGATLCHVPELSYGNGQRTMSYTMRLIESDSREAMLLFGFDKEAMTSIAGYALELSHPRLFNIPFDRLKEFAAQTGADPKCAASTGNRFVISRSLVATLDVTIVARRPLKRELLEAAARSLSPSSPVTFRQDPGGSYAYSARLTDRWVGIAIERQR